jgi:type II secretory pathway component GspD/PulD (secretin)
MNGTLRQSGHRRASTRRRVALRAALAVLLIAAVGEQVAHSEGTSLWRAMRPQPSKTQRVRQAAHEQTAQLPDPVGPDLPMPLDQGHSIHPGWQPMPPAVHPSLQGRRFPINPSLNDSEYSAQQTWPVVPTTPYPDPVPALGPSGPIPVPQPAPPQEPRFSFRFQGAPWPIVLRQCARDFGMSLDMRQPPGGTLSYFDENEYSQSQFLDILNDHLLKEGFVLTRNGTKLSLFAANERIDDSAISFVQMPHLDALGRNEVASVAFPYEMMTEGTVAELQQVLSPLGRIRTLANARRVIVTDTGSYLRRIRDLLTGAGIAADDIQTVVFRLRNAPAEEAAAAINNVLIARSTPTGVAVVPAGGGQSAAIPVGPQFVVPEKITNRLFVRGTSQELGLIERLICDIDSPPPQVFIQALLVEVQLGNMDEFGVDIGVQDSVLFNRSIIDNILTVSETVTSPNGTQTTNQRIVSQTANPGFNFNNQPLGNNVTASPSTVGTQGLSNLGVGRVNGDLGFGGLVLSAGSESISVMLRALSARHHIDILSRPQIRTLDNHEAVIQIGQQVPVVDGVAITGVGSANPIIRQDQAGIILRVLPRIGLDGLVLMNVNAEKSAFQLAPGTGVPIFTDATNGNVIEAPVKDVTSAQTAVGAHSGQTIVLGGMITRDNSTVERKVPWLGDIPLIGLAFRYDQVQSARKELLIFLTPHILEGVDHETRLKQTEASKVMIPMEEAVELHGDFLNDGPRPLLPAEPTLLPVPNGAPEVEPVPPTGWTPQNSTVPPKANVIPVSAEAAVPNKAPAETSPPAPRSGGVRPWSPWKSWNSSSKPEAKK